MNTKQRTELHLHTNMSKLDGISTIEEYIEMAVNCGMTAIAVTDHGVVHSFPDAYKAAKINGIKLIYGMEAYLVDKPADEEEYHISILVKNKTGLKNLYKLISKSHIEYSDKKPLIPRSELINHREGLLLGSACAQGELFKAISEGKNYDELFNIAEFYDYLEVQPVGNYQFLIEAGVAKDECSLADINKAIVEVGKKLNKLVVATGDVHYACPEQRICREIIAEYGEFDENNMFSDLHLKSTAEMLKEFSYLSKEKAYEIVVENSNRIADLTEDNLVPIPDVFHCPAVENANEELRTIAYDGVKKLYGKNPPDSISDRLERELNTIFAQNKAYLFIIAKKLAEASLKDGYLVGNRGNFAASFAAFACGITEINPLSAHYSCIECCYVEFQPDEVCGVDLKKKVCPICGKTLRQDGFDIPMELFFGPDGNKVPIIDINFSGEFIDKAVEVLKKMFGCENVIGFGTVNYVCSKVASYWIEDFCSQNNLKLSQKQKDDISQKIGGIKRATSKYPGAWFIVPDNTDIYDFTPINCADIYGAPVVTHFSGDDLMHCMQRFNILGNDEPTLLKHLYDKTGVNPVDIPLDDEKTLKLICSGETDNIKSFSSDYCKKIISDISPSSFDDLIRIFGLLHGTAVWEKNGKELIEQGFSLKEIISCRDDIMNYLVKKGIGRKEAYAIMDASREFHALNESQKKLMRKSGVPEWYIESCCKIRYMFPRAHCATYALMAFRIAYYKAHFPKEFANVLIE